MAKSALLCHYHDDFNERNNDLIFSFECGNAYHIPTDCDTIKKWLLKCADDSETANYISANTKDVSLKGNQWLCDVCSHATGLPVIQWAMYHIIMLNGYMRVLIVLVYMLEVITKKQNEPSSLQFKWITSWSNKILVPFLGGLPLLCTFSVPKSVEGVGSFPRL